MPDTTYYADGQWNFTCDLCGRNAKSGKSELTWNGLRVCTKHKERRNQQDFVRGVKAETPIPWSRPGGSPVVANDLSGFVLETQGGEEASLILTEDKFIILSSVV